MTATETLMAVLGHEAALLEDRVDQDAWRRGYCPVCGGGPDVGILKEGKEESEFLIAKAGQLWLHCGQCAALWRFPRLRCVGCGCEDPQRSDLLMAEGDLKSEVERAHLCQDCRTYTLSVNLVDRVDRVNLEMLPIGLLHLDVLAQERGFSPLAPSPWNTLG
jgi:FdhE protein